MTAGAKYKDQHRREKNKVRKLTRYLKKHPKDKGSLEALEKYKKYGTST